MRRDDTEPRHSRLGSLGLRALVPGLGHLALGRTGRGIRLMLFSAAAIFLMVWRWDRFADAFSAPFLDRWLASVFLILVLVGAVWYSRLDVGRIQRARGEEKRPGKSPWAVAMRRFRQNRLAVYSIYVIILFYALAILAPILAPYDPAAIPDVMANRYLPPSWAHPFGTDEFGRDLFSRALYGARVSLSIGLLAMIIAKTIGTLYGSVAAYFGGVVDNVLMRIVDVWIAFPTFYLMLMLVGVFEANIVVLVLILGLTAWPGTARFIRGEILSLKNQAFTESARAIGLPAHRIIVRHLIPSALSPVLVTAALAVAGMIGAEAGLSYLGLGIRPPTPSWGNMVAAGKDNLLNAWWVAFFPGGLLTLTLISFSLLADGLRDALDPKALMQKYV
ncbi:MAG: ABC transporter permease [Gemmatimonadales bacterium]|jgi:peptide/nickel transport system permease protein